MAGLGKPSEATWMRLRCPRAIVSDGEVPNPNTTIVGISEVSFCLPIIPDRTHSQADNND